MGLAGSAFVNFKGDYTGLIRGAGAAGTSASKGFSSKFGSHAKVAMAAAGVAAAAAVAKGFGDQLGREKTTDKLAAQLGGSGKWAEDAGNIAGRLYAKAYGDSLEETSAAVRGVLQQGLVPSDASEKQVEGITTKVLDLTNAFDQDLSRATSAAGTLMKNGLARDADEAMDILTRGFQTGIDKQGDFLDTMIEYPTLFRNLGIDGATATGLLSQGLQAGARDADKVADSLKEFSIRAVDGSELTAESFARLGLSGSEMSNLIAAGGPKAAGALDTVLDRLRGVEDPAERAQIATGLFGVQAEDLGAALFALDPSSAVSTLGEVSGAAEEMGETLNDNGATRLEAFKRTLSQGLSDAVGSAVTFFMDLGSSIADLGAAIRDNKPLMAGLVAGTAVLGAVVLMSVVPAFFAWAAGAWATAVALFAIYWPVIAVVAAVGLLAAGIMWAYENVEWFHNAVDTAWQGIQMATDFLWNSVIKPIFEALVGFIKDTIIPTALSLWDTAQTVFAAVAGAVLWAWESVIQPVFQALWGFVTGTLIPGFQLLLGAGQWVFSLLWAVIQDAWEIIRPIFDAVWWVISNVLVPVFENFLAVGQWVFAAVHGAVTTAWDIIKPVFEAVVGFIQDKLAPVWSTISDAVTTAFDKIPGAIRGALRLAGNIVAGFMRGVASVADTIGLDNIAGALRNGADTADSWGEGGGSSKGPDHLLAKGGYISRKFGGTPGKDSVPAMLMPGEFVMRTSAVDKFGVGAMSELNAGRLPFAAGGMVPGYKDGGVIGAIKGGIDKVKDVGGSLLDKARSIAAGALEKIWPKMSVHAGLTGMPSGGYNHLRGGVLDKIRGEAKKIEEAEAASGHAGGLAGSTTGLNPEFLRRFQMYSAAVGGLRIVSGFRSRAKQAELYRRYLNGTGNLAAPPGRSNHERGLAIDHAPRATAGMKAIARGFRLHYPVRGEPWHVEPFANGGLVKMHRQSFDTGGVLSPGWNMVRNDTGAPEDVRPTGGAPMIGEAHFHDGVDLDLVMQKMSQQVMAGAL